jgi:hypothetical protein
MITGDQRAYCPPSENRSRRIAASTPMDDGSQPADVRPTFPGVVE